MAHGASTQRQGRLTISIAVETRSLVQHVVSAGATAFVNDLELFLDAPTETTLCVGRTRSIPVTETVEDDATEFLNVDLEVFSTESLALLVKGLGRSVHVLHQGRWGRKYAACVELWSSGSGQKADVIIRRMVRLLNRMPRNAKALWNRAQVRQFNIGIQSGFRPPALSCPCNPTP
jgi:hypothetical protein